MTSIARSKKAVRVREWSPHQLVQQGCAVLTQQDSAVLAQQDSAVLAQQDSAVLAQQESDLLISAMCQIDDPSQKNQTCKKQIDALQQRLAKYERGGNSAACMVSLIISLFQHKDWHTQSAGQSPHRRMDISSLALSDVIHTSC